MQVDFMIIGAQKCGTTSLAAQLAAHVDVCFCQIKEPGYFNETDNWQAGLADYHRLYTCPDKARTPSRNAAMGQNGSEELHSGRGEQIYGEASTMYTFFPEWQQTHERIFSYNPHVKLIYIMRDPVARVISHYSHNFVRNIVKGTPEQVVLQDPAYVNRSRYAVQLRPYIELFGLDNMLLLIFEEYIANQSATLQKVAEFLGVSPQGFAIEGGTHKHSSVGVPYIKRRVVRQITETNVFQSLRTYAPVQLRHAIKARLSGKLQHKPDFPPQLRQSLRLLFQDDIGAVEAWLGQPIASWQG